MSGTAILVDDNSTDSESWLKHKRSLFKRKGSLEQFDGSSASPSAKDDFLKMNITQRKNHLTKSEKDIAKLGPEDERLVLHSAHHEAVK